MINCTFTFVDIKSDIERIHPMSIIINGRRDSMLNEKVVTWFFVLYWAVVLVITLMNKMMLSMDLMAIGMLLCALEKLLPRK